MAPQIAQSTAPLTDDALREEVSAWLAANWQKPEGPRQASQRG